MQDTLAPALVPPLSLLDRLAGPVWGIDPSTQRISLGILRSSGVSGHTQSLAQPPSVGERLWRAYDALADWFETARRLTGEPIAVALEVPFATAKGGKGGKGPRVPVRQYEMQGIILAALAANTLRSVEEVSPSTWKAAALGKGHGFAKPPEYVRWAEAVTPWRRTPEHPEDEAAAIGVSTWAALRVLAA